MRWSDGVQHDERPCSHSEDKHILVERGKLLANAFQNLKAHRRKTIKFSSYLKVIRGMKNAGQKPRKRFEPVQKRAVCAIEQRFDTRLIFPLHERGESLCTQLLNLRQALLPNGAYQLFPVAEVILHGRRIRQSGASRDMAQRNDVETVPGEQLLGDIDQTGRSDRGFSGTSLC